MDRRRNQPEPLEAVRDGLLLGEDVVVERPECEFRSLNGSLLRSKINAARFREDGRDLIAVLVSPCRRRGDRATDRGDDVRMLSGEVAVDQKERVLRAGFSIERQGVRLLLELGDGEEWIPDRPGVDRAAEESGGGVGRREMDRVGLTLSSAATSRLCALDALATATFLPARPETSWIVEAAGTTIA